MLNLEQPFGTFSRKTTRAINCDQKCREIKKHAMFAAYRVDVTIFREDSLGHKTLEIVSAQ